MEVDTMSVFKFLLALAPDIDDGASWRWPLLLLHIHRSLSSPPRRSRRVRGAEWWPDPPPPRLPPTVARHSRVRHHPCKIHAGSAVMPPASTPDTPQRSWIRARGVQSGGRMRHLLASHPSIPCSVFAQHHIYGIKMVIKLNINVDSAELSPLETLLVHSCKHDQAESCLPAAFG
uniref:Uncharacterized protein n=1 Tax=Oryza glumipatula TaxID=40148 RepID=A0A0D9YMA3_9ORYZ